MVPMIDTMMVAAGASELVAVMHAAVAADPLATVPEHERRLTRSESYPALLARLSRLSVTKHLDAYADVDWTAQALLDETAPSTIGRGPPRCVASSEANAFRSHTSR